MNMNMNTDISELLDAGTPLNWLNSMCTKSQVLACMARSEFDLGEETWFRMHSTLESLPDNVPLKLAQAHKFGTLLANPAYAFDILRFYGLDFALPYVQSCSSSKNLSALAPYHSSFHERAMIASVYDASLYYKLSTRDTCHLLLAAAFHDCNHSAGAKPDSQNINEAVMAFNDAINSYELFSLLTASELAIRPDEVIRLIRTTEYPYVKPPTDLLEEIMRDADLSMIYLSGVMATELFVGLYHELKIKLPAMSWTDYVSGMEDFYKKHPVSSEWAKNQPSRDERIDNLVMRLSQKTGV